MSDLSIVAVNVGNTRSAVALFESLDSPKPARVDRFEHAELDRTIEAIAALWAEIGGRSTAAVVVASVNDLAADPLVARIAAEITPEVYRVGDDLDVPIATQLDPETITGVDRLLNAAAAWEQFGTACVVVDAGTAVTVDFVDGAGIFHGGAIAPGAAMQLASLQRDTAMLPRVDFEAPGSDPFGRNTREAMLRGVYHGIRGLVWRLVEQYATSYGAFPPVIATGGDAALLFAEDELVDRVAPDLTLVGIAIAARSAGRAPRAR